MSKAEYQNFGKKLAFHTAPTLLGIKCASLFSLSGQEFDIPSHIRMFNEKATAKGLKGTVLCNCKQRTVLLIYQERLLAKRLADSNVQHLLCAFGYADCFTVDQCLARLSERMRQHEDFPHEIGVFLDYPLEDVVGFMENKGENFKFCGCWKVYGSESNARRTFANYKKCRNFLCNKLNEGADLYQALKLS